MQPLKSLIWQMLSFIGVFKGIKNGAKKHRPWSLARPAQSPQLSVNAMAPQPCSAVAILIDECSKVRTFTDAELSFHFRNRFLTRFLG